MPHPIHLYQLDIDPAAEQHLLSLTQRHSKLAVEHGHRQTTLDRRAEIRLEIEAIRVERDLLLVSLRQQHELLVAL